MNIHSGYRKLDDYKGASCGQHSALSTQHSALSTFNKFFRRFFSALLIIALPSALAAPIYYNPWDRVQVTSAEQACLGTINYFKNNPPNTYIDWSFVRSEFGQDFDSRVIGANGNYFSGSCIMTHTNPQVGTGTFHMEFSVACLTGYIVVKKESNTATCISDGLNLTLTPAPNQKDPRPKGTEGKDPKSSTYELIAKVMEGSTPKAGVAVTFKVEVKEGSGEHGIKRGAVHDHGLRVKLHNGKVPPSGVTNVSGEIRIKFEAPEPAGTHTITATCETCSNKTAAKDVKVLVPDLVELTTDTGKPQTYALIGHESDDGKNHNNRHFFSPASKLKLVAGVIPKLFNAGWGVVEVNDASLTDGGLFDVTGLWSKEGGHAGHRIGTEVDIRTNTKSPKTIREGYKELCRKENASLDIQTLWHKKDKYGEHFHIYLSGNGITSKAKEGCCEQIIGPLKNDDGTPKLDVNKKPIHGNICE